MELPLVSVICLCYNHADFVEAAVESVLQQSHPRTELIVVDDGSTDGSVDIIRRLVNTNPEIIFVPLNSNLGNCKAFNVGLARAGGSFIIDLAADDVLLPTRISAGLQAFHSLSPDYGVHFTDAQLIDRDGQTIGFHSERFPHASIPHGDIYEQLITRYFVNSPTMMIRREVIDELGGYDESLTYEDFDFWIRSSRNWKYAYSPEALVRRRILPGSMSSRQRRHGSPQLESTYKVCKKIKALNRSASEQRAWRQRVWYELRQALVLGEIGLAWKYFRLMN